MLLLLLQIVQMLVGSTGSMSQYPGYTLDAPGAVTVEEGLCTLVPCSFSYPLRTKFNDSQAFGYWFKHGPKISSDKAVVTNDLQWEVKEETRGRFHLVGEPMRKNCSLNIVGARKSDSGQYFFRIDRGLKLKFNYLSYMVNVTVKDLTQKPIIYSPKTLEPGQPMKVICVAPSVFECRRPAVFSWTGTILSPQELKRETVYFSELTLTPRLQDHGSNLTCQVTVPGASISLESTIHLSVVYRNGILSFSNGILLGAGIMTLLALCLILALVKFLRKKQIKDSDLQNSKEVTDANEDQPRDPSLPLSIPATQAPSEEIHYASINFRKVSP